VLKGGLEAVWLDLETDSLLSVWVRECVLEVVLKLALLLRLFELELEVVLLDALELDELVLFIGRTHPAIGCETTLRPDAVPGLTISISTHKSGRVTVMLWDRTVKFSSRLKTDV
jgi:hypothetical protein